MEPTWRLYAAIILGIIALVIVFILIFLLLNPKKNSFDRSIPMVKKNSEKRAPGKVPPRKVSPKRK